MTGSDIPEERKRRIRAGPQQKGSQPCDGASGTDFNQARHLPALQKGEKQ